MIFSHIKCFCCKFCTIRISLRRVVSSSRQVNIYVILRITQSCTQLVCNTDAKWIGQKSIIVASYDNNNLHTTNYNFMLLTRKQIVVNGQFQQTLHNLVCIKLASESVSILAKSHPRNQSGHMQHDCSRPLPYRTSQRMLVYVITHV